MVRALRGDFGAVGVGEESEEENGDGDDENDEDDFGMSGALE